DLAVAVAVDEEQVGLAVAIGVDGPDVGGAVVVGVDGQQLVVSVAAGLDRGSHDCPLWEDLEAGERPGSAARLHDSSSHPVAIPRTSTSGQVDRMRDGRSSELLGLAPMLVCSSPTVMTSACAIAPAACKTSLT